MKRIFLVKVFVFVFVILGSTSCSDFLTTESKNEIKVASFYSTTREIDDALIGVYGDLKPFGKYYWIMSEIRSDNVMEPKEVNTSDAEECSQFDATNLIDNSTVASCWSDHYALINAANVLIANLDNVTFSSTEIRNQYEAECRFLRALSYFDLVRFFGNIPVALEPVSVGNAFYIEQSTEKEVYENAIIPDLEYAIANLAETATDYEGTVHKERATKMAAKALLAKVYMQMAGYPLQQTDMEKTAKAYLEEILTDATIDKYFAPDADAWGKMTYNEGDYTYAIFEIGYGCAKGAGNTLTPLLYPTQKSANNFVNAYTTSGAHCYMESRLAQEFLALQGGVLQTDEEYTHDARFPVPLYVDKRAKYTVFIGSTYHEETGLYTPGGLPTSTTNFMSKFLEHAGKRSMISLSSINDKIIDSSYWPQNLPLLRIEDLMLLYAELAGKDDAKALAYMQKIRTRAGLSTPTYSTDTQFLEAVKQERRYELMCEGQRWFDEVRQNTFVSDLRDKFMDYRDNHVTGETNKVVYTTIAARIRQGYYLYPIPLVEIQNTSGLYQQNAAYKTTTNE